MTDPRFLPATLNCEINTAFSRDTPNSIAEYRIALRLKAAVASPHHDLPAASVLGALERALQACCGGELHYRGTPCRANWQVVPGTVQDFSARLAVGVALVPAASIPDATHPAGAAVTHSVSTPVRRVEFWAQHYTDQRHPPTEQERRAGLRGQRRVTGRQVLWTDTEPHGYITVVFLPVEDFRRGVRRGASTAAHAFLATSTAHELAGHVQGEVDQPRLGPNSLMFGTVSSTVRRPLRIDDATFTRIVDASFVQRVAVLPP